MSWVALVTDRFDDMTRFYGDVLRLPVVDAWDRPGARGSRFQAGDLRVEVLDNARERQPARLEPPGERFHVVVEVADVDAAHRALVDAPPPRDTSWGARTFLVRDPDGTPVTVLAWARPAGAGS